MKIEIISGVHSNSKTKECKHPMGINTHILIDGKKITDIDFFYFEVEANSVAKWAYGRKGEKKLKRFFRWLGL
jgi:hypothetical protein